MFQLPGKAAGSAWGGHRRNLACSPPPGPLTGVPQRPWPRAPSPAPVALSPRGLREGAHTRPQRRTLWKRQKGRRFARPFLLPGVREAPLVPQPPGAVARRRGSKPSGGTRCAFFSAEPPFATARPFRAPAPPPGPAAAPRQRAAQGPAGDCRLPPPRRPQGAPAGRAAASPALPLPRWRRPPPCRCGFATRRSSSSTWRSRRPCRYRGGSPLPGLRGSRRLCRGEPRPGRARRRGPR